MASQANYTGLPTWMHRSKFRSLENVIVEENSEGVYNTMWYRELKRTCKAKYSTHIFIRLCGKEAHVSRAPLLISSSRSLCGWSGTQLAQHPFFPSLPLL
jgi:hypothetical protein